MHSSVNFLDEFFFALLPWKLWSSRDPCASMSFASSFGSTPASVNTSSASGKFFSGFVKNELSSRARWSGALVLLGACSPGEFIK